MKRPLSICLVISLILCMALPAAALEQNEGRAATLHHHFISYLEANGVEHQFPDGSGEELSTVEWIADIDGWTIFFGHPGFELPIFTSDRIGDYVFLSTNAYDPYDLGVYAEKDEKIYTLKEACATGGLDIKKVAAVPSRYIQAFAPGDTDKNGGIEVKDVLNIQKAICKMTEIEKGCCDFLFYDFNADGIVDLKDVLALQKQLAKLS